MSEPMTEAGKALRSDIRELAEAFHQVGSIRDHADPSDRTGWNVHGIETCEDVYCRDALASDGAIASIEAEARADLARRIEERVADLLTWDSGPSWERVLAIVREEASGLSADD